MQNKTIKCSSFPTFFPLQIPGNFKNAVNIGTILNNDILCTFAHFLTPLISGWQVKNTGSFWKKNISGCLQSRCSPPVTAGSNLSVSLLPIDTGLSLTSDSLSYLFFGKILILY